MDTYRKWYVKRKVSVVEVHGPKVRGARANSPKKCSCKVIYWSCGFFPDTTVFYTYKTQIVVSTSLIYNKPYQNIFEFFWMNLKLWGIWIMDQSYLLIMLKVSYPLQPNSTIFFFFPLIRPLCFPSLLIWCFSYFVFHFALLIFF